MEFKIKPEKIYKKSQIGGRKQLFYLIVGVLAVLLFLFITVFVSFDRSSIASIPPGLENYLMTQRFLSSPCFAFQDKDTKRVYPLLIDLEKFSEANLNNCYSASETNVKAYRLTLGTSAAKTRNWEGYVKRADTKQVYVYDNGNVKSMGLFVETQDAK